MTRRSINIIQFWLKVGLFLVPAVAFYMAAYLRFKSGYFAEAEFDSRAYTNLTISITLLWALVVQHLRLNRIERLLSLQTGVITALEATAYCGLFAMAGLFFYRGASIARWVMFLGCVFIFFLTLIMIHLFRGVAHIMRGAVSGRFRVAVLGTDELALRAAGHLARNPMTPCQVACFVALPGQPSPALEAPVLAWNHLNDVVELFQCKEIVVALPLERLGETQALLESLQQLCIPARVVLDLGRGMFVPDRIFDFYGLSLLDVRPYAIDTVGYAVGKRIFDIVFSVLALAVTMPLMLLIAILIKLGSRGPVFFRQERVSLNGKRFTMLKFRTMAMQDHQSCNTQHTARGDPRITRIGHLLRHSSLDELPQFLNVLKGDMSVVGPRPELTFFVQKFRTEVPAYMARHNVKCGITGWAQVNGLRGSTTSIADRIQYDLYYLRNWSMIFDLKIIFLTLFNGVAARNAF